MVKFYQPTKLLSYNALLNFVIGERGVGKTYSFSKFAVKQFIKDGSQFVYLRRYKSELQKSASQFFEAIASDKDFEDVELKYKQGKFIVNGEVAGYSIALSTSSILKSTSFPKVKSIIFDEFILDKGVYHYLADEITKFLDVIETIARLREIHVYLLANAITISNPYFAYFNLSLPYNSEYKTFKKGTIVVNYIKNLEYREAKKASRFGTLIDGTDYGKYAIDNEFLRDNNTFVEKKQGSLQALCTLIVNGKNYGIWRNNDTWYTYISKDFNANLPYTFAFSVNDHNVNTVLTSVRKHPFFKMIVDYYDNGLLRFESIEIKNLFIDLIQKSRFS